MLSRCRNPANKAYANYGGRGITVCERWLVFDNFYADMGDPPPGMMLERRDGNNGYSPDNCIWADRVTQNRNRSNVRMITAMGMTKSMGEWSEITGLKIATIWARINKGWTEQEAVTMSLVAKRAGLSPRKPLRYQQGDDDAG